jgi:homoserine O-succinyltransferase
MPLTIETPAPQPTSQVSDIRERRRRRGAIRDRGKPIVIGLVNNMPDGALAATERQFGGLLDGASGEADLRLRLYTLRQVPRSREAQAHIRQFYADASVLRGQGVDALIVTGAEPVASDLTEEPYWPGLTGVIDWAEGNTISTVLSCLAAHAGVLSLSGVKRLPLPAKCSGVHAFDIVGRSALTRGAGRRWLIPHSRRNGLDPDELARHGYTVLTRSASVGVDMFVKQLRSLFVFLQGHPEYEADTLAREYRRDMGRYLRGEAAVQPELPQNYFSSPAEEALMRFAAQSSAERRATIIASLPEFSPPADAPWRGAAALLYRNWLALIAERKAEALLDSPAPRARYGG